MTDRATAPLDELTERLEKASGPDREIDVEIALLAIPHARRRGDPPWIYVPSEMERDQEQVILVPLYTASWWSLCGPEQNLYRVEFDDDIGHAGRTSAIVLCIAALKARQHQSI